MGLLNDIIGGVKSAASAVGSFVNDVTGGYANGALGAIASSAVQGAVAGIVVGAATSAIRGEDIVKGALQGAAYGSLAGGGAESLNQLMTNTPGKTIMDNFGGGAKKELPIGVRSPETLNSGFIGPLDNVMNKSFLDRTKDYAKSDSGGKIIGGMLSGAASAYTANENVKSAEKIADKNIQAQTDLMNQRYNLEQKAIAANQPGIKPLTQTAIIHRNDISAWWEQRLQRAQTATA